MNQQSFDSSSSNRVTTRDDAWLTRYYAVRAVFSVTWVAIAFSLGKVLTPLGAVFLVIYQHGTPSPISMTPSATEASGRTLPRPSTLW